MPPIVLVHGGSFAGSCWDLVTPLLDGHALAVDLPGRGSHPAPPESVTIANAAASVVADIDGAGLDDVVLVGHSLAGTSMPATIGLLGERVRHAVFVACTVPSDGASAADMLPPELQSMIKEAKDAEPGVLDDESARVFFGNDLDDEEFAWCRERMVPEALTLVLEPVDLAPLRRAFPRTWVRPIRDAVVAPDEQLRFARHAGGCEVVDLDAGHMCMIGKPVELADILNRVARTS